MDDLFVADRALDPQDIVRLMNENQLQSDTSLSENGCGLRAASGPANKASR
jgi:hypothetical protein